jgi:hypothetical protein
MNSLQNLVQSFPWKTSLIHRSNSTWLVGSLTIPVGIRNGLNRSVDFDVFAVLTNGVKDIVVSRLGVRVFEPFGQLAQSRGNRLG